MKKIIALAVAAVVAAPAMADLTIGANADYTMYLADGDASSELETNVTFAGSATSESGITVGAFLELEVIGAGDAGDAAGTQGVDEDVTAVADNGKGSNVDIDDQYLTIGTDMATLTLAQVGGFAASDAFSMGPDTASQMTGNYGASSQARNVDTALTVTPTAGLTLQVATSISDANDAVMGYVAYAADAVTVAASMENGGTDATDGYALSVDASVGGADVGAAYARNDAGSDSTRVSVGFGALSVAWATNGTDDDIYGEYAVGEIAPGASVTLAAGNYEGDSLFAVNVAYSF